MPLQPAPLAIGQLAAESGEPVKTLRYWTDLGLLSPERAESGYRRYPADSAERVQFIRSAQRVGFRLGGIARILSVRSDGLQP